MLVRADPVFARLDRMLGFVLLFTDLTERKAAEAARRGFQEEVDRPPPAVSVRLDSNADLMFRQSLGFDHRQRTARRAGDRRRVDLAHMPQMLEPYAPRSPAQRSCWRI